MNASYFVTVCNHSIAMVTNADVLKLGHIFGHIYTESITPIHTNVFNLFPVRIGSRNMLCLLHVTGLSTIDINSKNEQCQIKILKMIYK